MRRLPAIPAVANRKVREAATLRWTTRYGSFNTTLEDSVQALGRSGAGRCLRARQGASLAILPPDKSSVLAADFIPASFLPVTTVQEKYLD